MTWQKEARQLLEAGAPFEEHWQRFQGQGGRPPIAWEPDAAALEHANLTWLQAQAGVDDYRALHRWSVDEPEAFWSTSVERLGVQFERTPERMLDTSKGSEDVLWWPGARLNAAASCFPAPASKPAIIIGGEGQETRTVTYGELRRLADAVSQGLVERGFQAGDAVALYMPMNVECVAAYLGIVQAGMVVISIPDSFAPDAVAMRLRLAEAKAVVTVAAFQRAGRSVPMYPKAREAADTLDDRPIVFVIEGGDLDLAGPDDAWSALLAPTDGFDPVPCDPYDTTNILFSSGTTGEPKAIPWNHMTPFKSAIDGHWHQDIHSDDVVAWPTNIGWMMGPWLIYASLVNQATMALYEGVPTSQEFLDFTRDAKVTVFGLVPAIARAWRERGVAAPGDLPDIRVFSSTGEASNAHDYLYLMSLASYRAPIIEYCGGTEIGGGHITGTVVQPASPATFTTPALGIDFVLLDDGAAVTEGMGQLYLVPPSLGLSQRLLNRDHHEEYFAGCPAGPGGEVLRRHGDEMEALPGGFWAAQGRADDTMNLGGIKVGSIELERAMNEHEEVSETAAVAIPPPGGGADRLVVFAVPVGSPELEPLKAALQQRIKQDLNPLFRIHDVVLVDALPRTASNKVMRRKLRAEYVELEA